MASTPTKHKRGSLSEIFPGLNISPGKSPKAKSTKSASSFGAAPKKIVQSLRAKFTSRFPPQGSIRQTVIPPSFTRRMQGPYEWFHYDNDSDDLFRETEGFKDEITELLQDLTPAQNVSVEQYLVEALTRVVFGSNLIEIAGSNFEITLRICTSIFQGEDILEEITERDPEYEKLRTELIRRSGGEEPERDTVIRTRREIVQHARALCFIIDEMVVHDKPLTEDMILEAHTILTYKVDASGGDKYTEYGGVYRTVHVGAGLTPFTAPENVPSEMRAMISEFNRDLDIALKAGYLDPYMLAAKYCHKFVNIHPFVDGNGRTCRLILNAILLKHAGIVVPLGEKESDRDAYLAVANRASASQQTWDNQDMEENEHQPAPWSELAYVSLRIAKKSMQDLKNTVKGLARK